MTKPNSSSVVGRRLRRYLGALLAIGFGASWWTLVPHAHVEASVRAHVAIAPEHRARPVSVAPALASIERPEVHEVEPIHRPVRVRIKRPTRVAVNVPVNLPPVVDQPPTDVPPVIEELEPIAVIVPQPEVDVPDPTGIELDKAYFEHIPIRTRSS